MIKVGKEPWCIILFIFSLIIPVYAAQGVINVNTATKEELMMLPRIGEKTASAIVAYRQVNGPFRTIGDMTQIKGVNKKKLDMLRPFLVLTGRNTYIPAQVQKGAQKNASQIKQQ
jgi:competence ComEA-like helix-hairpin-helix protein